MQYMLNSYKLVHYINCMFWNVSWGLIARRKVHKLYLKNESFIYYYHVFNIYLEIWNSIVQEIHKFWCIWRLFLGKRQQGDSPAVTVCALNKKTEAGWKTVEPFNKASALDHYCDEQKSVKNATDCVEKKTFNFTETIKALKYLESKKVIGDSVYKAWRQYFFDFKSGILEIRFLFKNFLVLNALDFGSETKQ